MTLMWLISVGNLWRNLNYTHHWYIELFTSTIKLLYLNCNEELNDLYSSPNIVWVIKWRRMRWAGHVARMGERRGVYRVLVGKYEGKIPIGRPRRRWDPKYAQLLCTS